MMVYELLPLSREDTDREDRQDSSPHNFGMDIDESSPENAFSNAFKFSQKKIMSVASTKQSTHNTAYNRT